MSDESHNEQPSFVELNRCFRKLEQKAKAEDAALASYTTSLIWGQSSFSWDALLDESRVIILGEPGSGKTWELRERVKRFTSQGRFAFFIRLDQLAGRELWALLSADEQQRFMKWKQSNEIAHFFLDSVDEAKFRKISDFYAGLERFRNDIGADHLGRAKIFLSSRISEWKPSNDAFEFRLLFPLPPVKTLSKVSESKLAEETPVPLVVHIQPLDRGQVETLARAHGISNLQEFVGALDRAFAWEFARRPLDVADLIGFWKANGRIGSLTELIEFDVSSKLRPREGRDEHPLSEAEGREGAEWLAAATVFSRTFSFFVPDDGSAGANALNPLDCLPPNWRDGAGRALLTRAIFDSAVYGRFRFHHRRVGEYLAAKWIAVRMEQGCQQYELEQILIENVRGRKVLRPALRSVVAWLCYGNERWNSWVRSLVVEADPEIHLNYGDPSSLSLEYRLQLLARLARLSKGRGRIWIQSEHDCLARLADPVLAPDITSLILDRSLAVDFRIAMLALVRYGRMIDCLAAATSLVTSVGEPDELKCNAVLAIGEIGDSKNHEQLMQIVSELPRVSSKLCLNLVQTLYPIRISAGELVQLLAKTEEVRESGVDFQFYLRSHFQSVVRPEDAADLLRHLIVLTQTPPLILHGQKRLPVSERFYWVGRVIPTILDVLFKKPVLLPEETELAAKALELLGHIREYHHEFGREETPLNESSLQHPQIRQKYVWRVVAAFRKERNQEPTRSWALFDHWEVLRFSPKDFHWLIEDTQRRSDPNDRLLALRLAIEAWDGSGRTFANRWRLRRAIRNDTTLRAAYRESGLRSPLFAIKKVWWHRVRYQYGKWWWLGKFEFVIQRWRWLRGQFVLFCHLQNLEAGERIGWLDRLLCEAAEEGRSHWTIFSWSGLEKNRGKRITRAARRGCMAAWRCHMPALPHEKSEPAKTSIGLIVGLTGLQVEFEESATAISKLTEQEAKLAARYAMDELNGFPTWFERLAAAHPKEVNDVLSECVEAEWRFPSDRQETHEVLAKLMWRGKGQKSLAEEKLLSLLDSGDPQNCSILRLALSVLMSQCDPPLQRLGEIAAQRVRATSSVDFMVLWLTVWMQIDAEAAVTYLEVLPSNSFNPDDVVVRLCSMLSGEGPERGHLSAYPSYLRPACLRRFIPLVYRRVRPNEDLDRVSGGAYSPTARDHAQRFRSVLLDQLATLEALEATNVLRGLSDDPAMSQARDWILNLLEQRLEREADLTPWTPADLRCFANDHEVDPKTDKELFAIACKRIQGLKFDVEESDNSLRDELHADSKELHFRRWLARRLNERAKGRYSMPQEPEIDLQQRPDLRFLRPGIAPISVEAKFADLGWSVSDLFERLENQLVGQYLRDHQSRYGIYVIATIGRQQHWKHPQTGQWLTFVDVISLVSARANEIVKNNPRIGNLAAIGIDFREPKRP